MMNGDIYHREWRFIKVFTCVFVSDHALASCHIVNRCFGFLHLSDYGDCGVQGKRQWKQLVISASGASKWSPTSVIVRVQHC